MLQPGDREINEKRDKVNYWPARQKDILKVKGKFSLGKNQKSSMTLPRLKRANIKSSMVPSSTVYLMIEFPPLETAQETEFCKKKNEEERVTLLLKSIVL